MSKSIKIIICIAATIIIALPICYQAYVNKLFIYDEGYYFIQAYELGEHGNFFIDFDPSVKLRNTKPYLFSALQTLLGITIGWNEWALRLPTIASAVALVWMIFLFIKKTFQDTLWALCASTLLLVFPYYVYPHMAFTGDHDVPLIFFTTAFIFSFYLFLISADSKEENKYIRYACIAATASILTKGLMILFFLPFCLIFLFVYKKQNSLFFNRTFWIGIFLSLVALAMWYLGREYINPGYLDAVWKYEIGRYNDGAHTINPEWKYYWLMLFYKQVQYWLLAFVIVLYMLFFDKGVGYKSFLYYVFTLLIGFLVLISFSDVKLLWYDASVLPLLAVMLGAGIAYGIKHVSAYVCKKNEWGVFILYMLVFSFFYIQIFNRTFSRVLSEEYGGFIMNTHVGEDYTIVHTKYNPHLIFYNQLADKTGTGKRLIQTMHSTYKPQQKILICEPLVMLEINREYTYEVLDSTQFCKLIQIKNQR